MSEQEIFPNVHKEQVQLEAEFDEVKQRMIQNGFEADYDGPNKLGGRSLFAHSGEDRIVLLFTMPNDQGIETVWKIRTFLTDLTMIGEQ